MTSGTPCTTDLEPQVLTRQDMSTPHVFPLARGRAVVWSSRSPDKTTDNEDGAAILPHDDLRGVLVLADGLGGHASGAEAAEMALRSLAECVQEGREGGDETQLRSAILDGFELANERIVARGTGAATTLAAVEIDGEHVRPYHVGDSMILVTGQRGRLKLRTMSHSPVGYGVEAGLLDAQEAIHHEERHVVSNIVGCETMRIDVGSSVKLGARDTVVLASDGLFDNLHLDEIVQHVRKGPLERSVAALVAHARERMGGEDSNAPSKPDDLTVVVYRRDGRSKHGAA